MEGFRDVIDMWPTRTELAKDCQVSEQVVHKWHMRNSVDSKHWSDLLSSAKKRHLSSINAELLIEISAKNKHNNQHLS